MSSQPSFQFCVTRDASLFGLNMGLDVHLSRLQAATVFSRVRKEIDRNITVLKTLSPMAFGKRRTKDTFRANVELAVTGAPESEVLLPLLDKIAGESAINVFILTCFTMTKTTYANLKENSLTDVFADFLACIIDDFTIFPSMREKFINIIKDVCRENNETSDKLLRAVEAEETAEGVRTKRRRLDFPGETQHRMAEQDEVVSLVFEPELLSPLEAEREVVASSVPPDHIPRRTVSQFSSARIGRLRKILEDSPLLQAITTSNQWRWERNRGAASPDPDQATDAIAAMIPDSNLQDISFVLRVGYRTGWKLIEYLKSESSSEAIL